MSRAPSHMLYKGLIPLKQCAGIILCALFMLVWIPLSAAQTVAPTGTGSGVGAGGPPPDVSFIRLPARDPNAITVDGWLLYPSVRLYSLYTDNFFQTPTSALSVGGFGVTPSMVAVWSNGIHTTTLYGSIDRQDYPSANAIDTLDGRAGFTQRYEAMRDLIFTFNGNYAHTTLTTGLQNSIQTPVGGSVTLPNGNTLQQNGTVTTPSGQVIVQGSSGSTVPLQVNPSNQFTGTFTIDKIFNRAALSLSGTVNRTEYENQSITPNFSSRTFSENASAWLGPLIYAYSSGTVTTTVDDAINGANGALPSISTTSYRVIGGLGTRFRELFVGTAYFGHQGSESGGATAEGNVYGGSLSYAPTLDLTFTGTVDRTVNNAAQPFAANLALTLPGLTAIQIPLGESTISTSFGWRASYAITQQWFANCQLSYGHIEYPGTPRLDNTWVLDTTLRYDIWRNMSIIWEYRYSTIISNAPLAGVTSNYGIVGTTYRF
jgi:hypothetical protein